MNQATSGGSGEPTPNVASGGAGGTGPVAARPLTPEELGALTQRAAESIGQAKTDVQKVIDGVKAVAAGIEGYGQELIKSLDGSATGLTSQVEAYATRAIEAGRIIEQARTKASGK